MQTVHSLVESWLGGSGIALVAAGASALLISLGLGWIFSRISVVVVTRWLTPFDCERDRRFDRQVSRMRMPLTWFAAALIAQSLIAVALPQGHRGSLRHAMLVVALITGGWLMLCSLSLLEEVVCARTEPGAGQDLDARRRQTQVRGFRNIAGFLTIVVTIAFVLLTFESVRQLGAGILASAGVAGVILGFAAQRSISTIVAGVQIALSQPIRVGDVVIVEGDWGTIEEITLTYVVVKIWDLRRLIVPINYFIERPFQNWTRTSSRILGTVELHVDYTVPVAAIRNKTKELLDASSFWDGDVWSVQVVSSDAHSMIVRPLFSAKNSGDQWNLRCELREKLIAYLQQEYPNSLPRVRADVGTTSTTALERADCAFISTSGAAGPR